MLALARKINRFLRKVEVLFFKGIADFLQKEFRFRGCGGFSGLFRRAFDLIHDLHKRKYAGGNDHKFDHRIQKNAVTDDRCAGFFGLGQGVVGFSVDRKKQVAEVHAFEDRPDRRHDHIHNEAVDDFSKRGTDDDADSQVNDITTGDKFFEFLSNLHAPMQKEMRSLVYGKNALLLARCPAWSTGGSRCSVAEFFSEPAEGEAVARAICGLGVDFLVAENDGGLAFDLADTAPEVGAEFIKGPELILGGCIPVEITDETNTDRDVVQVVASDMAAVDLSGPPVSDFDLAISRGIAIADDEMVGEAVLHFANASVVDIENTRVSLAGATIVNDDVFPASALDLGIVDGLAQRGGQIAPSFHEAAEKRFGPGFFFVFKILRAGFLD